MYVAMIAIGEKELDPLKLEPYRGTGIEGIRLTFHKKEISQAVSWAQILMEKGYRVFMQPVGTVFYSDMELLQLVERINELSPYAFYIVDTLGSMYRNDVSHRFYVIDKKYEAGNSHRLPRSQQPPARLFQRSNPGQNPDQADADPRCLGIRHGQRRGETCPQS